jgi:hypothetical protein
MNIMSSSEGLDRLKNWQRTDAVVKVLSSDAYRFLAEDLVKVVSVGASKLVFSLIGSRGVVELDVNNAEFSVVTVGDILAVQIKLPDGTLTVYAREVSKQ